MFGWLRRSKSKHAIERAERPPRRVELYTRVGCHLCDDAAALLARYGLHADSIDVDLQPELKQRYGDCVPVVVIDGRVRFRGRIDERLLRRLLNAPRPVDER